MPPKRAPLKLLALHGHAMNPVAFEKRIGAVRSDLKKLGCEFVFGQGPIIPPNDWMEGIMNTTTATTTTTTASTSSPNANADGPPDATTIASPTTMASTSSNPTAAVGEEGSVASASAAADTQTVYSWGDFWSWKRGGKDSSSSSSASPPTKPVYYGFDECVKTFHKLTVEHGPFDGILAFSQGTGAAALWLALEAQELKRQVADLEKKGEDASSVGKDNENVLVADDSLPLSEWRIPTEMHLLKNPSSSAAAAVADGSSAPSSSSPRPFLLINVSGVVQRDDTFGSFVTENLKSLPASQERLRTLLSTTTQKEAPLLPLRPLHVLNVFGTADNVVLPEVTKVMTDLYSTVCNAKKESEGKGEGGGPRDIIVDDTGKIVTKNDDLKTEEDDNKEEANKGGKGKKGSPSSPSSSPSLTAVGCSNLAFGGCSMQWSHEGGHVVPSAVRKPLKGIIEALYPSK